MSAAAAGKRQRADANDAQVAALASAAAAGRRRRADANDAQVAALCRQIEALEGENAALRSARRLLADDDRSGEVKRLRAERRKLTGELRDFKCALRDAFTNLTLVTLVAAVMEESDGVEDVLLAVLLTAELLGVNL
jgi:hypothetical protein